MQPLISVALVDLEISDGGGKISNIKRGDCREKIVPQKGVINADITFEIIRRDSSAKSRRGSGLREDSAGDVEDLAESGLNRGHVRLNHCHYKQYDNNWIETYDITSNWIIFLGAIHVVRHSLWGSVVMDNIVR
jgi:hypothetical protein